MSIGDGKLFTWDIMQILVRHELYVTSMSYSSNLFALHKELTMVWLSTDCETEN